MNWTKEQYEAIHEKGENILVAAAARKRKNSGARGEDRQNDQRR